MEPEPNLGQTRLSIKHFSCHPALELTPLKLGNNAPTEQVSLMSSTTNLVVNDGTANQTFAPVKRDGGRLTFLNKVGAVASAFKSMALGFDLWSTRRATTKVQYDLDFPLARVDANGVVTATDVARCRVVHTLPKSMTAAEKAEYYNLFKNGVSHASVSAYVTADDPMM